MRRALVVAAVALSAAASAQPMAGSGRVTVSGGWRYTPNDVFTREAAERGLISIASPGGPALTGTFAYAATDYAEISIDVFATGERLRFSGAAAITTVTYGAWIGGRLQTVLPSVGPISRLIPFVGAQAGPTLILAMGGPQSTREEQLTQGFAGSLGMTALFGNVGATLEARYVLAFGTAAPVGVLNGGGLWVGLGFTWMIPPAVSETGGSSVRF